MNAAQRHEFITLGLIVIFGFIGWGLFAAFGKMGEWFANFLVIPPVGYYLVFAPKDQ